MLRKRCLIVVLAAALLLLGCDEAFKQVWERSDKPVTEGRANRSWTWGPQAFDAKDEPYKEAPGGMRQVVYHDKARMEVNNPNGNRSDLFYVTNGRLPVELISGRIQMGETQYRTQAPATIPIAGDNPRGHPDTPTYATLAAIANIGGVGQRAPQHAPGTPLRSTLARSGAVSTSNSLPQDARASVAVYVPETGHNIPVAFWDFLNQSGTIYENGAYTQGTVVNWVYAMGYPITEAHWIRVRVAGVDYWVLFQAFERRVLTFNPANAAAFQVEVGNVGRHYHDWRYAAINPQARVIGSPEMVFDWSTQRCEDLDVPDVPARAFRDSSDQVQLIASHYINRRMIGPDLNRVSHDCGVIMSSHNNPDPSQFDGKEYIHSTYTLDGNTIYALVHNEYQGHQYSERCPSAQYSKCWYNAITLAVSSDGGKSYNHARPPSHLVASIPYRYVPDAGPFGIFNSSNIIYRAIDGNFYTLIHAERYQGQPVGTCLMRTNNLADPTSWRAWSGKDFTVRFINPYLQPGEPPQNHVCQPIAFNEIEGMGSSLTYNTYFDRYLLVGGTGLNDPIQRRTVYGVYYSLSSDLLNWTPRKLLMEAPLGWSWKPGEPDPIGYPSLLDPLSFGRNFETTGKQVYLYFTRTNYSSSGQGTLDRDLLRVPVEFSR